MVKQRKTSAKVAKIASKLLRSKGASKNVKKTAASALSQRAPKRK
jgi:hypothetical protein